MRFPIITTPRLVLRAHTEEDQDEYLRLFSDKEALRYYGRMKAIGSLADARAEIIGLQNQFLSSQVTKWAVMIQENSQYIGCVGIKDYMNRHRRGTLSCIIAPEHWGQGYAQEALGSVIHYGFTELSLNRIQAFVDPKNHRAVNMFTRLGFNLEATLNEYEIECDNYINISIFGLINREQ